MDRDAARFALFSFSYTNVALHNGRFAALLEPRKARGTNKRLMEEGFRPLLLTFVRTEGQVISIISAPKIDSVSLGPVEELNLAARILQRIACMQFGQMALAAIFRDTFAWLRQVESSLTIEDDRSTTWLDTVKRLWLAMMTSDIPPSREQFIVLSCRLLAFKKPPLDQNVYPWLRQQVLRMLISESF